MRDTCIYMISSTIKPERIYIGSAVSFKSRVSVHISELKKNKHHAKKLQRHFNKYGLADLVFKIIEIIPNKQSLLVAEQKHLDFYKPYFNSNPTAGSNLGRKFGPHSEEHKEKIRIGNLGKTFSKEWYKAHSLKISKYSIHGELLKTYESGVEAAKAEGYQAIKMKYPNITCGGYVWVTEKMELPDFEKIREMLNASKKAQCKPVIQIDKSGNEIAQFEGVRIACKETGIDHRSIAQVAGGSKIRKTAGGYLWKYKQIAA